MSCRAFSRQIEHHTLQHLFRFFDAESITLDFQATERNEPTQRFLRELGVPLNAPGKPVLRREAFPERTPDLPNQIVVREDVAAPAKSA